MITTEDIHSELKTLQADQLIKCGRQMPFTLPEGYFQSLQEVQIYWVNEEATLMEPTLVTKEMPYAVPQNYFQQNVENMVALAASEPTLDVAHKNIGSVPEGYFEEFPAQILNRIKNLEQAKNSLKPKKSAIIDFKPADYKKRSIRLAAAVVAFLLGGWGVMKVAAPSPKAAAIQTVAEAPSFEMNTAPIPGTLDEVNAVLLANQFAADLPLEATPSMDLAVTITNEDIIDYMTGDDLSL